LIGLWSIVFELRIIDIVEAEKTVKDMSVYCKKDSKKGADDSIELTAGDFDFIYKVVYGEYEEGSCGVYCVHDGDGKIEKTLREDESVHTEEYVPNCHVFD